LGEKDREGTTEAVVAGTADPAFATDCGGTIVAWNEAAQRLLGYDEREALGASCYTLLGGRDVFGNLYCNPHCPLMGMTRRNEAVGHFELCLTSSAGRSVRVGVSVAAVPAGGATDRAMVHILHPAPERMAAGNRPGYVRVRADGFRRLTPREIEVARLLDEGRGTQEIADLLFISVATVRRHVQSILRKLSVHSRLEAVAQLRHLPTV
jgi:PAS domain S-box-containing protein